MPTTLEDIKEREEQLKRTGAKATQLAGVGSEFMSQVREELRKRAEDKGVSELTKAAAATRKEYAAAPARIREEYKDIDPFRRMTLESERRGDIMAELTEIMDLKGAREKGITDILEMGRAGIQAESERAQAQFGMEQKLYENVVGQWKAEQDIRLKEIDQAIEVEQIEANRTYQEGMLAYYRGDLDVSRDQLAESKRHSMTAELLESEKWNWEKPYLERKYEYELGKPYYAPPAAQEPTPKWAEALGEALAKNLGLTTPTVNPQWNLIDPQGNIWQADSEEEYQNAIRSGQYYPLLIS